ncbi:hypothetical protein OIU78_027036 [Salix suchowensis]|nr:hypothetical protein OIU78_027036 [Salix suchowensis]
MGSRGEKRGGNEKNRSGREGEKTDREESPDHQRTVTILVPWIGRLRGLSQEMLTACLNAGCDLKQENGDRVFLLPPNVHPTLVVVGPLIQAWAEFITPDTGHKQETIDNIVAMPSSRNVASALRRR